MSQNTLKRNPNTLPASPAPTMPASVPRSKAQDLRDGAAALNETAQTAFGIYNGFKDREERQFNSLLDRQAPRFDKSAELIDADVSEGNMSLREASDAHARLAIVQGREARETLRAIKDGAVKESKAGRNWLIGIGTALAGGGVLAWGLSQGD